jgi:hypothetical protein
MASTTRDFSFHSKMSLCRKGPCSSQITSIAIWMMFLQQQQKKRPFVCSAKATRMGQFHRRVRWIRWWNRSFPSRLRRLLQFCEPLCWLAWKIFLARSSFAQVHHCREEGRSAGVMLRCTERASENSEFQISCPRRE